MAHCELFGYNKPNYHHPPALRIALSTPLLTHPDLLRHLPPKHTPVTHCDLFVGGPWRIVNWHQVRPSPTFLNGMTLSYCLMEGVPMADCVIVWIDINIRNWTEMLYHVHVWYIRGFPRIHKCLGMLWNLGKNFQKWKCYEHLQNVLEIYKMSWRIQKMS